MTEEKEAPETNGQEKKEEKNDSDDKTELETDIIHQVEYYFGMSKFTEVTACLKLFALSSDYR